MDNARAGVIPLLAVQRAVARKLFTILLASGLIACSLAFPVHERAGDNGGPSAGDGAPSPDSDGPTRSYRDEVLADAPSVYLRFGEKRGTMAADEMRAFAGTYPAAGVTYGVPGAIAGDADTAIAFDGTSGVTMPPGLDFAGQTKFSIELWAKQTSYLNYGNTVDHGTYASRSGWTLRAGFDGYGIERWSNGTTGGSTAIAPSPLALGAFHHLVGTFDGAILRVYLDGALVTTGSTSTTSLTSMATGWMIGMQNCACSGQAFVGALDEVAVYPIALGADRILTHYRVGSGT